VTGAMLSLASEPVRLMSSHDAGSGGGVRAVLLD
jgi:hypothetical protein